MQALIKVFDGYEVTMRQIEGRWGMTLEQFGIALGYEDPLRSVARLIDRNRAEVAPFLTVVKVTTVSGERDLTVILDQGIRRQADALGGLVSPVRGRVAGRDDGAGRGEGGVSGGVMVELMIGALSGGLFGFALGLWFCSRSVA